jgi:hypothetical protein
LKRSAQKSDGALHLLLRPEATLREWAKDHAAGQKTSPRCIGLPNPLRFGATVKCRRHMPDEAEFI